MKRSDIALGLAWFSMVVFAIVAAAGAASTQQVSLFKPAAPPAAAKDLKPGLRVEYIAGFIRHIDEIADQGKGRDGGILKTLDWSNADGEVLTSGRDDGVAARITGFINFGRSGEYVLAIQSNDGVRLSIGGKLIIDDPQAHPDRFSPNVSVRIETPGWYRLYLLYFERKGASTMELYWQPPGANGFDYVPATAFMHNPSE
jgi:hypothetical protein